MTSKMNGIPMNQAMIEPSKRLFSIILAKMIMTAVHKFTAIRQVHTFDTISLWNGELKWNLMKLTVEPIIINASKMI